jgi:hypothetical protein
MDFSLLKDSIVGTCEGGVSLKNKSRTMTSYFFLEVLIT